MKLVMFSSINTNDEKINTKIITMLPKNPKMCIIPAFTEYYDESWYSSGYCYEYSSIGFQDFEWFDIGYKFKKENMKKIFDYDAIHLGGGNTFLLKWLLNDRKMIKPLIDYVKNGGVLFGNSAGSIMMCKSILVASFADENYCGLKDFDGLGLVNFDIKPHWEAWIKDVKYFRLFSNLTNRPLVTLKEDQCITIDNDEIKLWGNPYVIKPVNKKG